MMETKTTNHDVEEKLNRWTEMFGTDVNGSRDFLDYLKARFWEVRGSTVDTEDREFRRATPRYVSSLVRQSGYWEKAEWKDVTKAILDDVEVSDDLGYKPVGDLVLSFDDGRKVLLNRYKQPSQDTVPPTDFEVVLWDNYWESLILDDAERLRLIQWAAHVTRKPEVRTGIVVLVHGTTQGSGKSTLGEMVGELVGHNNTTKPTNPKEAITGRFNGEMEGKVLFVIDELYANENFAVSNAIKCKVTEPKLSIERKGVDAYTIDNFCNFFATSNHLTPVGLEKGDRRWEVYSVEHTVKDSEGRKAAVVAFREWFESDRVHAASVLRYLLSEVDLSDYEPEKTGAMHTVAKKRIIEGSISAKHNDFENYWLENKIDEQLIVQETDIFAGFECSTKATERTMFLLALGCKKLDSNNCVKINGVQKRKWWVTPLGFEKGMQVNMDGGTLTKILSEHCADITQAKFDDSSSCVELTKISF
jgi:hypothetical protein